MSGADEDLAAALDGLFAGRPEAFVEARDALARRLKAAGRPDDAAAVKRLRKPAPAVFAANRLARDEPAAVERALAATARAAKAQADLRAETASPAALRAALDERRAALAEVARLLPRAIEAAGGAASPALVAAAATVIRDAAAHGPSAAELRAGRLEQAPAPEPEADLAALLAASAAGGPSMPASEARAPLRLVEGGRSPRVLDLLARLRDEEERAARALAAAEARSKDARRDAEAAGRRADELGREAEAAEARAREARRHADAAAGGAARAREGADAAEAALARAREAEAAARARRLAAEERPPADA